MQEATFAAIRCPCRSRQRSWSRGINHFIITVPKVEKLLIVVQIAGLFNLSIVEVVTGTTSTDARYRAISHRICSQTVSTT